jgi:hypothetical protein
MLWEHGVETWKRLWRRMVTTDLCGKSPLIPWNDDGKPMNQILSDRLESNPCGNLFRAMSMNYDSLCFL